MCLHGKNRQTLLRLFIVFFFFLNSLYLTWASPGDWALSNQESARNAGDPGDIDSIPGLRRSLRRNDKPTPVSLFSEDPMERDWRAADHGVSKRKCS